jgi:uncharacterized protein YukE
MPRNSSTNSNAMIGDAKEMYSYIDHTKKMMDELIKSRKQALDGIEKMGDRWNDKAYQDYKAEFEQFSKYIDKLNAYNEKSKVYYGKLVRLIEVWNKNTKPGIPEQNI